MVCAGNARRRRYPPTCARNISALWREALALAAPPEPTLVLRDYHVDNLMLLPDRDGVRRCGLLDFQDALCRAGEL